MFVYVYLKLVAAWVVLAEAAKLMLLLPNVPRLGAVAVSVAGVV